MVTISKYFDHIYVLHDNKTLFAITPYGNTLIRHPYDLYKIDLTCEVDGGDCDF